MANITSPDKTTGDIHYATEYQQFKDWMNSPSKSLSTWTPGATVLDTSGYYSSYAVTGNISVVFSGTPKDGIWQRVRTTGWNGTYTLTRPGLCAIMNSSFTNGAAIAAGTYDLWFAYVGGAYLINLVSVDITFPTITSFTMASDNTYGDLVLSEGIYGANDGSTAAALADLTVTFAQAGGTATGWTASSAKQNDSATEGSATALAGGETTVRVFGSITGTADGNETVTVSPADGSSLYDVDGNAMDSGQSAVDNLSVISAEAQAVLARMTNLTTTEVDAIIDFVDAEVANGNWALTDEFFMFGLNSTDYITGFKAATLNPRDSVKVTAGLEFNGSDDKWATADMTGIFSSFTQNDAFLGVFVYRNDGTTLVDWFSPATANSRFLLRQETSTDVRIYANVPDSSGLTQGTHTVATDEYIIGYRSNSNTQGVIVDGVSVFSGTRTPTAFDWTLLIVGSSTNAPDGVVSSCVIGGHAGFDHVAHNTNVRQLLTDLGL